MNHSAPADARNRKAIAIWLLVLCGMVFITLMIGGITRLTHSGLSMVEWRPVTGWLPPLNEAAWQDAFAKYREFPEYRHFNTGMTLAEFKEIFWLEFIHRLWGRVIGLAFLIPFLVFAWRKMVDIRLAPKLLLAFVLGGLQGVLGWYMVQSGLVDRPDVSQYRLTAHLGAALVIYAYLLWLALALLFPEAPKTAPRRSFRFASGVLALACLTILSGGFVAGLDAGFAYNTFPLMDGQFVPDGAFELDPWYRSLFEDIATVQFDHRCLALATLLAVVVFWFSLQSVALASRARLAANGLLTMALIQVTLGIATLMFVVPVPLAALHQAGAVGVFSFAVWTVFELSRRRSIG